MGRQVVLLAGVGVTREPAEREPPPPVRAQCHLHVHGPGRESGHEGVVGLPRSNGVVGEQHQARDPDQRETGRARQPGDGGERPGPP